MDGQTNNGHTEKQWTVRKTKLTVQLNGRTNKGTDKTNCTTKWKDKQTDRQK